MANESGPVELWGYCDSCDRDIGPSTASHGDHKEILKGSRFDCEGCGAMRPIVPMFAPPLHVVETILDSMKAGPLTVERALMVEIVPSRSIRGGWPARLIGIRFAGPELVGSRVGVWATGTRERPGLTGAVNGFATEYSPWMEPANVDSPEQRLLIEAGAMREVRGLETVLGR